MPHHLIWTEPDALAIIDRARNEDGLVPVVDAIKRVCESANVELPPADKLLDWIREAHEIADAATGYIVSDADEQRRQRLRADDAETRGY